MSATLSRPILPITTADLTPGPGLSAVAGAAGADWFAGADEVRLAADGSFPPGWYHVRIAIRSATRFTVRKRCEVVFESADDDPQPPVREQFAWNRNFDEQFMLQLTRPSSRLRVELKQAEGRFTVEQFEIRTVPRGEAFRRAVREKVQLLRAYQCVRLVLLNGGKMLLTGRFRQFGEKVFQGLTDARQMRLGHGRGDEVDAAWWRRHALTRDEARKVADACEAMVDPPSIAVVIPIDGLRYDHVRLAAHSVRRQIYPHWELLLAVAGPAGLEPQLTHLIGPDPRMRYARVSPSVGLATAVGKVLGQTECQRVVVLPPGVELAEHALYHLATGIIAYPTAALVGGGVYDPWQADPQRKPAAREKPHGTPEPSADEPPVPPVLWASTVRGLASALPPRLTMRTIADWTQTLPGQSDTTPAMVPTVVAYPVSDRPLIDRALVGRKPIEPKSPLFLSTDLVGITGYDHLAYALLKGLPSAGADLRFHQVSRVWNELLPPGLLVPHGGWRPDCAQIILSTPSHAGRFQPNKKSAIFTMWETDRLEPEWVETLNKAGLVVVPSRWAVDCFRACGVRVPLEVAPLGYDPLVFHPRPTADRGDGCVFGTAGALSVGGLRKNAQLVVDLFRETFPTEPDVRLRVKITPSSPGVETGDDPRVEVIRAVLPHNDLVEWYRSLTAYVNASAGEGFGLHLIEAMACGRPLISPDYSGLTEFFDETVGYPVGYTLKDVDNEIYSGRWAEPWRQSLSAQMRRVYADRDEADRFGERAAARAKSFTWKAAGRALAAALRKHGFIG